jgi:hypothetical protein
MNIEIPHNVGPKIIALFIIIPLIAAAIWCLTFIVFPMLPGFYILKITSIAIIICLFLFAVFVLFKQIFSKKPALIINEKGLTDYSSISSAGFIPWSDIVEFKESVNSLKQKLLLFIVKNPHKYIDTPGAKMSNARQSYHNLFGTPVVVAFNNLKYDYNELISILKKAFNNYKE